MCPWEIPPHKHGSEALALALGGPPAGPRALMGPGPLPTTATSDLQDPRPLRRHLIPHFAGNEGRRNVPSAHPVSRTEAPHGPGAHYPPPAHPASVPHDQLHSLLAAMCLSPLSEEGEQAGTKPPPLYLLAGQDLSRRGLQGQAGLYSNPPALFTSQDLRPPSASAAAAHLPHGAAKPSAHTPHSCSCNEDSGNTTLSLASAPGSLL